MSLLPYLVIAGSCGGLYHSIYEYNKCLTCDSEKYKELLSTSIKIHNNYTFNCNDSNKIISFIPDNLYHINLFVPKSYFIYDAQNVLTLDGIKTAIVSKEIYYYENNDSFLTIHNFINNSIIPNNKFKTLFNSNNYKSIECNKQMLNDYLKNVVGYDTHILSNYNKYKCESLNLSKNNIYMYGIVKKDCFNYTIISDDKNKLASYIVSKESHKEKYEIGIISCVMVGFFTTCAIIFSDK